MINALKMLGIDTSIFEPVSFLPTKYIINDGATILFWSDGTKTVVKKSEDDEEDIVKSFLWAYFQKQSGLSKTQANKYLKKIVDENVKDIDCFTSINTNNDFKVGDIVKMITSGEIYKILEINKNVALFYARSVNAIGYERWLSKDEIEKVQQ